MSDNAMPVSPVKAALDFILNYFQSICDILHDKGFKAHYFYYGSLSSVSVSIKDWWVVFRFPYNPTKPQEKICEAMLDCLEDELKDNHHEHYHSTWYLSDDLKFLRYEEMAKSKGFIFLSYENVREESEE